MPTKQSPYHSVLAILKKDALGELRDRFAFSALIMFAIVTLSSISMSIGGIALSADLSAALLWVILFFAAMAGLARVFIQEQDAGTLLTLRVYARPQAVLFGKMIFNLLLLVLLSILLVPLFVVFLNVEVYSWVGLAAILLLGSAGMAAVATITAAMATQSQGRSSLFTILTFPVLLPLFLGAISATAGIFAGEMPEWQQLMFLLGYNVVSVIAVSILFDHLWYD
jgi:heme exporter protein B